MQSVASKVAPNRCGARHETHVFYYENAPVAQWIEQPPPKKRLETFPL